MKRTEVELGDEPLEVRRRPRSGVVVAVRLTADEADRLHDLADAAGMTITALARQALVKYLRSNDR